MSEMEHFTRMIFAKNDGGSIGGSIEVQSGGQIGGQIGGQMSGQIDSQIPLTDRQRDILDMIRMDSRISRKRISELLDINTSVVSKHLDALRQKGVIKRVGGTRGYWEVMK